MGVEILIPIMGILLVMIPVAGVTFGLTLRFAVRPMVETLAKALAESKGQPTSAALVVQIGVLQEEVETLTREVQELRAVHDFDRRLLGPQGRVG